MKKKNTNPEHEHGIKLGQFFATAICGNDILSSALYVSGVAIIFAGVYAPIVLLTICLVLLFYKFVYTEVVEALPINGGAYNCLLNGSSKTFAATAGVMTILSYIATAVISGKVGVEYLGQILPLPVIPTTIVLLFLFGLLVIAGIKDSAKVAFGIFVMHIITLTGFLIFGLIYFFNGGISHFGENLTHTGHIITANGGILATIFLGFSASLLGVSGFESSANFVEEQKRGVFRKTLRNMLIGVALFNPLIALVILNCLPFNAVEAAKDFLLADAAHVLGGNIFKFIVVIDAFLVLWGAVLTAFVGVSGLIYRMAADACLPNFLTKQNKKGSFPYIILTFFILCSSILFITQGNLLSLAGVYTIAFLGVMTSFALGNLILKQSRRDLKRTYHAPVIFVVLAFIATLIGIIGNIIIDPKNFMFFSIYFIPAILIVFGVIYEDVLLGFLLHMTKRNAFIHKFIEKQFNDLIQGKFVVLIHNTHRIHKILDYIDRNETGRNVILVVCKDEGKDYDKAFQEIKDALPYLKKAGIYPTLNLSLLYKNKPFGPAIIDEISQELHIRKNRILIGSIHNHHPYEYEELGGVRIIF